MLEPFTIKPFYVLAPGEVEIPHTRTITTHSPATPLDLNYTAEYTTTNLGATIQRAHWENFDTSQVIHLTTRFHPSFPGINNITAVDYVVVNPLRNTAYLATENRVSSSFHHTSEYHCVYRGLPFRAVTYFDRMGDMINEKRGFVD